MALDKVMPDDMNEVTCALLAYINEEHKAAGAKMSYGDFGKYLAQTYGKHYHGSNPNGCFISGTPTKVEIETSEGTKYELTWNKAAKLIHPYLKSTTVSETVETDKPTDLQDTPTDTAAFDYSAVDEDTAQYLRKATARIANSYADIGAVLAEAQERLAHNNNGIFEKWFTSLGMSKMTVYRFIQIHNFRSEMLNSSQFGTNQLEIFDNLPKTLQADISSPSAPAEAVNAVLSGDITTHKDYIALKKRIEELTEELDKADDWNEELESQNADLRHRHDVLIEQKNALALELKEARSEAREVIMTDPTESPEYKKIAAEKQRLTREKIELEEKLHKAWGDLNTEEFDRRIAEISQKFSNSAAEQIARDRQASAELLRQRTEGMQEIIDGLEEKLRQLEKQPLMGYFLPASIEDYSGICGLLKGTKYEKIMYAAKLIKI